MKEQIAKFNKLFEKEGIEATCTLEWINGKLVYHLVLSEPDMIPTHYVYSSTDQVANFFQHIIDKHEPKGVENVTVDNLIDDLVRYNIKSGNKNG